VSWALIATLVLCLMYLTAFPAGQRPDRSFDPALRDPAYPSSHPVVAFDQGHNNAHPASGGYAPFVKLMQADGFTVRTQTGPFTPAALRDAEVLVIVNADGGTNPKLFGLNLVPLRKGVRGAPAFTADEVRTVQEWVGAGGSLLLVADHAPFGSAAAALAAAFGVTMHGGFTEVAKQYPGQPDPSILEFSTDNGLLSEHPITLGRAGNERIQLVRSFTGQSLDGPPRSSLLKLPPGAIEYQPLSPEAAAGQTVNPPAGAAQAVAVEYQRGRVVIPGEAAMITAQIDPEGRRFGMNQEGIDNRQFALNIMHWLSRLI
jgi:hypothetical protein